MCHRALVSVLLFALSGCVTLSSSQPPKPSMQHIFDNEAMREEVLKYLSVGMPIENAVRIMQASGFECKEFDWMGDPKDTPIQCHAWGPPIESFLGSTLVGREMFVSLHHEGGKLTKVEVRCQCVGV